jgi:hypothetical protein
MAGAKPRPFLSKPNLLKEIERPFGLAARSGAAILVTITESQFVGKTRPLFRKRPGEGDMP